MRALYVYGIVYRKLAHFSVDILLLCQPNADFAWHQLHSAIDLSRS